MRINKQWFSNNPDKINKPVNVLYHGKRIHVYKSHFKHGYRNVGFSINKDTNIGGFFGAMSFGAFQIGFSFR